MLYLWRKLIMSDKEDYSHRFTEDFEFATKDLEKVLLKKVEGALRFWKRKHDAGRVPDDYYEKTREALLKSLDDWKKDTVNLNIIINLSKN